MADMKIFIVMEMNTMMKISDDYISHKTVLNAVCDACKVDMRGEQHE